MFTTALAAVATAAAAVATLLVVQHFSYRYLFAYAAAAVSLGGRLLVPGSDGVQTSNRESTVRPTKVPGICRRHALPHGLGPKQIQRKIFVDGKRIRSNACIHSEPHCVVNYVDTGVANEPHLLASS